jgi:two-component system phosphate regulon sensor histidine kinase PhoR
MIAADPTTCRRRAVNLVDNAVKYTQEGGAVEVRVGIKEGKAVLEVEDNGPGIAKEHQARVFERFYRVDASRSRQLGGTGLGLAIVKHIALSLGGQAKLESEPGKGSRFTITVPISKERKI